jgi:cbb3-type cytochrome oxidase maturation protein
VALMYILLPLSIILASAAVLAFIGAVRGGQFDDTTTPAWRILFDDDSTPSRPRSSEPNQGTGDA